MGEVVVCVTIFPHCLYNQPFLQLQPILHVGFNNGMCHVTKTNAAESNPGMEIPTLQIFCLSI